MRAMTLFHSSSLSLPPEIASWQTMVRAPVTRCLYAQNYKQNSRTTVSQDVQTRFPVQLAFAKFLSKIKGNF